MIKKLLLSVLCTGMTVISYSQNEEGKHEGALLLTNHTVVLSDSEPTLNRLPFFDGKVYLVIQGINHKLDAEAVPGLTYLEYLPKNAALFSLDYNKAESILTRLQSWDARMAPLESEWKLSKRLFTGDIPSWAWLDNSTIKIWLGLHKDVSLVKARAALKLNGLEILETDQQHNLIAVRVKADEATALGRYPFVMHVQEMEDPGSPENWTARTSHRINYLQSEIPGNSKYDGSGVTLSLGDDGAIGPHIDYNGRLDQSSATASTGDHGDHVAGTIFGAGNLDPRGQGMAPGADIVYYTYPANLSTTDSDYNSKNVRLTSSSYSNGCNAGYTNFTRQMDQDYIDNPNLIHVFSAGNSGTSNCNYGAGSGWGNVTGGHKIAKNVVAVANLTRLDGLASSSSRGPANDGRIKPDVGAVGTSVYSTTNPNAYTLKTGTSMSCPGTSGTLAVLYEAYKANNGGTEPNGALLKAILMNSAEDLGNPGPDFRFGYGRINARKALQIIENGDYITGSLSNAGVDQHTLTIPGNVAQAKIMLYWGDVPASTIAARALVNDLDMTVTYNGNTLLPLVLDPTPVGSNLNANAVPARDSLNNTEQIVIDNPAAGDLTVNVQAFNVPQGTQSYYIVYTFVEDEVVLTHPVGGEKFVPGTTEIIRWDTPQGTGTFTLEYSTDNGVSWNNISSTIPATSRHFNWNVPNTVTGEAKVRVSRGNASNSPGTFTIVGVPGNLQYVSACPDTLTISWDVVPQAAGYVVYRLGNRYMDSIDYTVSNVYRAGGVPSIGEEWFSVAAVTADGGIGLRANARERPTGVFNCIVKEDLAVDAILSPPSGELPDCFNLSNIPIRANIVNNGVDSLFGFTIGYIFNNGVPVLTSFTDTLAPGDMYAFTSNASVSVTTGSISSTKLWAAANNDQNPYNDTITLNSLLYSGQTVGIPYADDFENSVPLCNTSSNCGQTVCGLSGGWRNITSGTFDAIDWRGNNGSTPSQATGPSVDFNPGTANGRYLYLEASACFEQQGMLQTPCFDLSTSTSPLFSFYYHMLGNFMGSLSVDVYDGDKWHMDVIQPIAGNQGNTWLKAEVDLTNFAGSTVIVRFRGNTGSDFSSDIAIDNINLIENSAAPVSAFTADANTTCINGTVGFSDVSTNFPNSWLWRVSPAANALFVNNDSTSANVEITFTAAGNYDITLISSNSNGSDTLVQAAFVTASAGASLSAFEGFEPSGIPQDWAIVNPDGFTAWNSAQVIGSNGTSTISAFFDHFINPTIGSRDDLIGINVDLLNETNPLLYFDVAYAQGLNNIDDSLIIMVSTNCGTDFIRTAYAKGGSALATVNPRGSKFIPQSAGDWRSDSLDLSPYVGTNIKVNFVTKSSRGNALYLDNIQLVNGNVQAPVADILYNNADVCVRDTATFSVPTPGAGVQYSWTFGNLASPNIATGPGPHKVIYLASSSQQVVTLTATNPGGRSTDELVLAVGQTPIALNSFQTNGLQVDFTDLSINIPTSWLWTFGDGDSSTAQSPSHTYATGGTYTVVQTASNSCGSTDRTVTVNVSGIGLEEAGNIGGISLYPNPSKGAFTFSVHMRTGEKGRLQISDLSGRVLRIEDIQLKAGENKLPLDLSNAAQGIYLLTLKTDTGEKSIRAFKE